MHKDPSKKSDSVTYTNEVCLLGAILLSYAVDGLTDMRTRIFQAIKPEMFFERAHRYIYEAILACFTDNVEPDLVIIQTRLKASGRMDEVGGIENVMRMVDETPNAGNAEEYAKVVKESSQRRALIRALDAIKAEAVDWKSELNGLGFMTLIHKAIKALADSGDGEAAAYLESIISEAINMRFDTREAIVTRLAKLDGNLNLFTPGEMTILAARPSVGKSTFMRQICRNAATAGDMLIFSMEVSPKVLTLQLACEVAGVSYYDWCRNKVTEEQIEAVVYKSADPIFSRIACYMRAATSTMDVLTTLTQLQAQGKKIDTVFIDYLGLMKHPKADRNDLAIGATTSGLKQIAMERGVSIILLCQLNRDVEKRGTSSECDRPRLADLRDSGNIEQDADNVLFLWRKERGDEYKTVESRVLTVAKHRNGQCFEMDLMFDKAKATFYEVRADGTAVAPPPNPEWISK